MPKLKYKQKKQKGLIAISKMLQPSPQGDIVVTTKTFDPETGLEGSQFVEITSLENALAIKEELKSNLESINEFIKDVEKL